MRSLVAGCVDRNPPPSLPPDARETHAKAAISVCFEADVPIVEDGGKSDFHYGKDWQIMGQPAVKVDRVLRDGYIVRLGEVILQAHHTPGHTRGATSWTTTLMENGKAYSVVFPDGCGFNPGYRVASRNPSYPGIEDDYRHTLHTLEMLKPGIWAGHHTEYFDLEGKRPRLELRRAPLQAARGNHRRHVGISRASAGSVSSRVPGRAFEFVRIRGAICTAVKYSITAATAVDSQRSNRISTR